MHSVQRQYSGSTLPLARDLLPDYQRVPGVQLKSPQGSPATIPRSISGEWGYAQQHKPVLGAAVAASIPQPCHVGSQVSWMTQQVGVSASAGAPSLTPMVSPGPSPRMSARRM
eukprot:TRINITY_DN21250_c0_g1_i1.p2 TRINITY_DN21250_c0_g1~~TRINITY_DN21250_c0_g1_i1.p2  ORF type:complete len:113 (+),score=8.47 TRINITY_DN21250_c0_g1_i1:551-889(+)